MLKIIHHMCAAKYIINIYAIINNIIFTYNIIFEITRKRPRRISTHISYPRLDIITFHVSSFIKHEENRIESNQHNDWRVLVHLWFDKGHGSPIQPDVSGQANWRRVAHGNCCLRHRVVLWQRRNLLLPSGSSLFLPLNLPRNLFQVKDQNKIFVWCGRESRMDCDYSCNNPI